MASQGIYRIFTRGVGRQILGYFLLAGLLPVIFTAILAYNEVHRSLKKEIGESLRESAENYGVHVLTRLERKAEQADALLGILRAEGPEALRDHDFLLESFSGVTLHRADGGVAMAIGSQSPPLDRSALNMKHLAADKTQLITGSSTIELVRALNPGRADEVIAQFSLDAEALLGPSKNEPHLTDYCLLTGTSVALICSPDVLPAAILEQAPSRYKLPLEWSLQGEPQLAAVLPLLLEAPFAHGGFQIIASQPQSYALRASSDFRRIFPPALALVVLMVAVLSIKLIARSLVPLQRLTIVAGQYAAGQLGSRVRIRTGDEFEELGDAFNNMAGKLGRQIDTLKAMSAIDRLILSGADFEEVSEDVIRHLIALTNCEAAAVIARDSSGANLAKMISWHGGEYTHERIALPQELGHQWCQPREVALDTIDAAQAPYKDRFLSYGRSYVVIIPVVMDDDLKGILLLGSENRYDIQAERLERCVDLAGRLAVALTSAEREEALHRQAHFDELTGLPNRQLLKDRLEQHLIQVRREERSGAMLFLDLDRFKEINDIYGHSIGDIVLAQAAERICAEVRDSDTVARLGGDEFVVVMPRTHSDSGIRTIASRLLKRLSEAFSVRGTDHFVSASIGIVVFPEDGDSVETLLKNADSAMYRAKESGRSCFEFYSHKLNAESRRKIEMERHLRDAVQNGELDVHYQPQIDLATGIICGAEALVRWRTPDGEAVDPMEFTALAEDSGLILDLGRRVIEQTCADFRELLDRGLHPGAMSINVSARQLRELDFTSDVLEPLRRFDIHPGYMQLEITETTVAQNRDTAIDILHALRDHGVQVAIDDFGTGYSSLSYLQQLPFDLIKIDKTFTKLIGSGDRSDKICRTIIRMAHELGKKAIAEGIETRAQADFLKANGCDYGQGYFFSVPLAAADFLEFVAKQDFHTQRRKALEVV